MNNNSGLVVKWLDSSNEEGITVWQQIHDNQATRREEE